MRLTLICPQALPGASPRKAWYSSLVRGSVHASRSHDRLHDHGSDLYKRGIFRGCTSRNHLYKRSQTAWSSVHSLVQVPADGPATCTSALKTCKRVSTNTRTKKRPRCIRSDGVFSPQLEAKTARYAARNWWFRAVAPAPPAIPLGHPAIHGFSRSRVPRNPHRSAPFRTPPGVLNW